MAGVFFDITIGGVPAGRIVMHLYDKYTPWTARNFHSLCIGDNVSPRHPLHYKGTIFHRVIPGMCQGGDFIRFNGTGGESIYDETFEDENFKMKHTKPGILSMANSGRNTNNSQFQISTIPAPFLDGKHVVFGCVIEGMNAVKEIQAVGSS